MKVRGGPTLDAARSAMDRHDWRSAFALYARLEAASELPAHDLVSFGKAAWWCGNIEAAVDIHERAYGRLAAAREIRAAARVALMLRHTYQSELGNPEIAIGWSRRAARLLAAETDCVEHGMLARVEARDAWRAGNEVLGREHFERALALAERHGDADLMAMTLAWYGISLIEVGEVAKGCGMVDEACASAAGGELGPFPTGIVFCNAISAYRDVGEYGHAAQWSERAGRWCARQDINGFPGICRVHRAEIMRLRGRLEEAEAEGRLAGDELLRFSPPHAADAFYEVGEVRLRLGDLQGAEDAFREARRLGHDTQPGSALLLLCRGEVLAAAAQIAADLAGAPSRPLDRARKIPGAVRCLIAARRLPEATRLGLELAGIAVRYDTRLLHAAAATTTGLIDLAAGEADPAALKMAVRAWLALDAPFEAAETRCLLAAALAASGDLAGAEEQKRVAREGLDDLGAARAPEAIISPPEAAARGATTVDRAVMFTDIVGSTTLVEAIGDEAWTDILDWHDNTLRRLFVANSGEEVDHAGDGFLVTFGAAADAVACAIAIQRELADHRRLHGFAPRVRIGLHAAPVTRSKGAYRGRGVHEAARIAGLAAGDEILAGKEVLRVAGHPVPTRSVHLKGIRLPVEVGVIDWHTGR
ncbi:MAG: hypothetical protein NVS9B1_11370 [Candidatus Dormibacteraceae bacterium]